MANQYNPDYVVSPGEILEEELEARNITPTAFAKQCGLPVNMIEQILKGKAPVTLLIAELFEQELGKKAMIWINLQDAYRESL